MSRRQYNYSNGPDKIQQHSIAKHRILQSYMAAYYQTLVGERARNEFRLTVVDGFAGAGEYIHQDTEALVEGSPLILLQAASEAEFLVNRKREKPVRFDVSHFFIEKNRDGFGLLKQSLEKRGYGREFDKSIFLRRNKFERELPGILEFIKRKSPRNGRAIFVLDQYGYNEVPVPQMRQIMQLLPTAEIILTFAVDSLLNYANDKNLENALEKIQMPDIFGGRTFEEIKSSEPHWRLFVQSCLYHRLVEGSGARYYTPFFIRNKDGHGDYWLLHLSHHPRARDVMTEVHWQNSNYFIHYGGAGLDMFQMNGYDPVYDDAFRGQNTLPYGFDDSAKAMSQSVMLEQIARLVRKYDQGITFGQLFSDHCNQTPATARIFGEVVAELAAQREIGISSITGGRRTAAASIVASDRIYLLPQRSFVF
ncbi:hypothetical protein GCM10007860_25400 [Chitiniphilus shinanonensis]|uniref:GMT-like wHTH domain-containing protein n=1 Tax=Chitiniphilus shinanonensis TaxID=553088 RepID=A0ABQ6BZQ2_9NEIS|nr:three-Cys-motif partner protein TcmP [Chitiniphilus shinanonensis]GLS05388.1 hypothetical protein GCM10007860_25400 [Chitiniphilus shinanonensis]